MRCVVVAISEGIFERHQQGMLGGTYWRCSLEHYFYPWMDGHFDGYKFMGPLEHRLKLVST